MIFYSAFYPQYLTIFPFKDSVNPKTKAKLLAIVQLLKFNYK